MDNVIKLTDDEVAYLRDLLIETEDEDIEGMDSDILQTLLDKMP